MERAKTETVSRVSAEFNRRIPRNDVAGIEERCDVKLAETALVAIARQNGPSKKTLHKSHGPLQQLFGGTLRRGGRLFFQDGTGRDESVECFLASCGDAVWINLKLFPKGAV